MGLRWHSSTGAMAGFLVLGPRLGMDPGEWEKPVVVQVCVRVAGALRKEQRPVIRLWCFTPRFPR